MSFFGSLWNGIKGVFNWFTGGGSGSSAAGAIASSALGLGANYVSSKQQLQWNKQLMKDQFNYNKLLQKDTYKYNVALQNLQNQYTATMSNTAHQREVQDLRSAGLNPILSANNGASTPSAGSAAVGGVSVGSQSVQKPDYDPIGTALAFRQQKNLNDSTASSVWLNRKQAALVGEQERNEAERYHNIVKEREKMDTDIRNSIKLANAQAKFYDANSTATLMNAISNQTNANANAYYQYNRALGKSESHSKHFSGALGIGANGAFKGKKPINFGFNLNPSGSYSFTNSQTW